MRRKLSLLLVGAFLALALLPDAVGNRAHAQNNPSDCVNNGGQWYGAGELAPAGSTGSCIYPTNNTTCIPKGSILGLPTWYKYLPGRTDSTGRCTPVIEKSADALPIGIAILDIMLRLAGIVAVVFIVWGAVKMIISQGEPDKAKEARGIIKNSIIGLIIVLISTGLVSFIGNNIGAS